MFNFFRKRHKIKSIPEKDRHKPSIILNTNKDKKFVKKRSRFGFPFRSGFSLGLGFGNNSNSSNSKFNNNNSSNNQSNIHNKKNNGKLKIIMLGLLGIGLLLGLVYLVNYFFTIKDFKLDKVSVLGNKTISEIDINSSINSFKGKHIALIDAKEIENTLKTDFHIIQGVQVTKQYPNKIFIKINEREPKIIYINLNGPYVLDNAGKVLKNLLDVLEPSGNMPTMQKIDYSQDKILIARGLGDSNSQIIQDYFLNEFILTNLLGEKTQAEREQFIIAGYSFDKITQEQKNIVLKKLAIEYQKEIEDILAKNQGIVLGSEYRDLPEVYSVQNKEMKEDEMVDFERQTLTLELINKLKANNMEYNQIRWDGSILVRIYLKDTKQLVFGSRRTLTEQWEDYLLIINELAKHSRGYSIIDISSTKISVIN